MLPGPGGGDRAALRRQQGAPSPAGDAAPPGVKGHQGLLGRHAAPRRRGERRAGGRGTRTKNEEEDDNDVDGEDD